MKVTIQLDAASVRQFARNLDLAAKEIERGMAKAINRTAFEILEAERAASCPAHERRAQKKRRRADRHGPCEWNLCEGLARAQERPSDAQLVVGCRSALEPQCGC